MSLISFVKQNGALHLLTNSLLLGTFCRCGGGRQEGKYSGLLVRSRVSMRGRGNRVSYGAGCVAHRCRVFIRGNGNAIFFHKGCVAQETLIWIKGDNNTLIIGDKSTATRCEFGLQGDGNAITIGAGVAVGGYMPLGRRKNNTKTTLLYAAEGTSITIGDGSLVSDGVEMRTGDSHPIFDQKGRRVNHARDIELAQRVWVGSGAALLKGAKLGEGCVLGYRSLLTKDFGELQNTVLAGSPAKPVREHIRWEV